MAANLNQRMTERSKDMTEPRRQQLAQMMKSSEEQFRLAIPKTGPDATQLIRDANTLIRNTPKLLECEPLGFIGALMTCAQLGLRPGIGALGEAWILPMWNSRERRMDATFVIGYPGMLTLANRSGEIDSVVSNIVYENDVFEADRATGRIHHPVTFSADRGKPIGYYAAYTRKGSDRPAAAEFMSVEQMREHRDKFAMAKKKDGTIVGPWASDFESMARKTMVRQLFKWMPRNTEIQNALIADGTVRHDAAYRDDLNGVVEQVDDSYAHEEPAPTADTPGDQPETS